MSYSPRRRVNDAPRWFGFGDFALPQSTLRPEMLHQQRLLSVIRSRDQLFGLDRHDRRQPRLPNVVPLTGRHPSFDRWQRRLASLMYGVRCSDPKALLRFLGQ